MASIEHIPVSKVTIETVDTAIHSWIDKVVDAYVKSPTQERQKVKVIFASGERFAASRNKRGVRDKNGVLILPIITVKRTAISPMTPHLSAPGIETAGLTIAKRISPKTNNLQNLNVARSESEQIRNPVIYELTKIPYPDFSVISYEVTIQAQYILQMNDIIQKFFHLLDMQKSFVMMQDGSKRVPPSTMATPFDRREKIAGEYFVGFIDGDIPSRDNFDEFTDTERIISYTIPFKVPAALQLDPEGVKPMITVTTTAYDVSFADEAIEFLDSDYDIELIFSSRDPIKELQRIRKKRQP